MDSSEIEDRGDNELGQLTSIDRPTIDGALRHIGRSDGYDAEDRFLNFNQSGKSKTLAMTRSDIVLRLPDSFVTRPVQTNDPFPSSKLSEKWVEKTVKRC
ncbi:hypothetical protein [Mariniblastus fucicola]|uniref:Uncharacterized protein n=1 Tax=Mariniblastus fucicola TaxID=980251 RepID=A0A5B9PCK9_9BACT|nr:hypothetical protein [Mariniblastus fucicola]QEG22790.1 hypothetical protein MFFC18_26740 [Mariniblastus fucicola]